MLDRVKAKSQLKQSSKTIVREQPALQNFSEIDKPEPITQTYKKSFRSKLFEKRVLNSPLRVFDKQIQFYKPPIGSYLTRKYNFSEIQPPSLWGCTNPPIIKEKKLNNYIVSERKTNSAEKLLLNYIRRKDSRNFDFTLSNPEDDNNTIEVPRLIKSRIKAKRESQGQQKKYMTTSLELKRNALSPNLDGLSDSINCGLQTISPFLTISQSTEYRSSSISRARICQLQRSIEWKKEFLKRFEELKDVKGK